MIGMDKYLLILDKSKKFWGIKILPVDYYVDSNTWIFSLIFTKMG